MVILSLFLGLFDRMRGGGWFKHSHFAGQLGMGVMIALLTNQSGWMFLVTTLSVILGSTLGWGDPLGAAFDNRPMGYNYESWQKGILRTNTFLALLVRGLIWGLPVALISIPAGIALTISFTVAPYWARQLPSTLDRWAIMEFGRGLITGLLIMGLTN